MSRSLKLLKAITSVTFGLPRVNVPVLSRIMALILEVFSRVEASLIKILCLAPMPVPTATAVGVASPKASGQAITTADIAKVSAVKSAAPAIKYQPKNAAIPEPIATSTSQPAALSAMRCPGALEFWGAGLVARAADDFIADFF